MFQAARLKLTLWYLLAIMVISSLFSLAIYSNVSHQIEGLIKMQNDRIRNFQFQGTQNNFPHPPDAPPIISSADLQKQEQQLALTLILINAGILVVSGAGGYILAGKTLYPIKDMVDEQNQFISSASHELRTPIAALRAEMEGSLLEKHLTDQQARQLIESNLEELGVLQNLSSDLLRITRVHHFNSHHGLEDVSLLEAINLAHKKISALAVKKKISIDIKVANVSIKGEKSSLVELFTIFLDNALKYSPSGSTINISSAVVHRDVKISITDQGVGISATDLPHIFERFYRGDKSRSQVEGFGLGLAIAKKIAESFNGSIAVSSQLGQGSTFTVTFPLVSRS
jgi:two-component system, OmpR family, sensor histidine kinase CiaH